MSISQPDPAKLRHLNALTHHLAQLSTSMNETEQRFARLQNLLLAMQAFGGGQAAQFMAVSQIVGQDLERDADAAAAAAADGGANEADASTPHRLDDSLVD